MVQQLPRLFPKTIPARQAARSDVDSVFEAIVNQLQTTADGAPIVMMPVIVEQPQESQEPQEPPGLQRLLQFGKENFRNKEG